MKKKLINTIAAVAIISGFVIIGLDFFRNITIPGARQFCMAVIMICMISLTKDSFINKKVSKAHWRFMLWCGGFAVVVNVIDVIREVILAFLK